MTKTFADRMQETIDQVSGPDGDGVALDFLTAVVRCTLITAATAAVEFIWAEGEPTAHPKLYDHARRLLEPNDGDLIYALDDLIPLWGNGDSCPGGWRYRAWYFPEGGGSPVMLADNMPAPYLKMPGTPLGAGHGTYAIVEFNPATGTGPLAVGMAKNAERNTRGESGEAVGTAAWRRTEYIHVDHLGSTRVVTDEAGAIAAKYKFYPFGLEADTSTGSDVRMKFTGHERDRGIGLDYMRARYCRDGRFLSPDWFTGSARSSVPLSWNRYSYVINNPLNAVDRLGLLDERTEDEQKMFDDPDVAPVVASAQEVGRDAGGELNFSVTVQDSDGTSHPTAPVLGDHDSVAPAALDAAVPGEPPKIDGEVVQGDFHTHNAVPTHESPTEGGAAPVYGQSGPDQELTDKRGVTGYVITAFGVYRDRPGSGTDANGNSLDPTLILSGPHWRAYKKQARGGDEN